MSRTPLKPRKRIPGKPRSWRRRSEPVWSVLLVGLMGAGKWAGKSTIGRGLAAAPRLRIARLSTPDTEIEARRRSAWRYRKSSKFMASAFQGGEARVIAAAIGGAARGGSPRPAGSFMREEEPAAAASAQGTVRSWRKADARHYHARSSDAPTGPAADPPPDLRRHVSGLGGLISSSATSSPPVSTNGPISRFASRDVAAMTSAWTRSSTNASKPCMRGCCGQAARAARGQRRPGIMGGGPAMNLRR